MNIEVDQEKFHYLMLKLGHIGVVPDLSRPARKALYRHLTFGDHPVSPEYIQGFQEVNQSDLADQHGARPPGKLFRMTKLSEWAEWLRDTGRAATVILCYRTIDDSEPCSLLIRKQAGR